MISRRDEAITLPSGICGDYEYLKKRFYANELTLLKDLMVFIEQARRSFDDHTADVATAFSMFDRNLEQIGESDQELLENCFFRCVVDNTREAAVIKGDNEAVKMIDRIVENIDHKMVERCRRESHGLVELD